MFYLKWCLLQDHHGIFSRCIPRVLIHLQAEIASVRPWTTPLEKPAHKQKPPKPMKSQHWGEEIVLLVKCIPCQHEDLSFIPKTHVTKKKKKKVGCDGVALNHRIRKAKVSGPLRPAGSQPSLISESFISEKSYIY